LKLLGSRYADQKRPVVYQHSENYQSIRYRDTHYSFSVVQAAVVKLMKRGGTDHRRNEIKRSASIFKV